MKLAFHDIIEPQTVIAVIDDGWFPHEEIEVVTEVHGQLTISRRGDEQAIVSGGLAVGVALACDRCCQPALLELEAEFDYDCIVGKEDPATGTDTECREEDCYTLYVNEPVIDLGDILKEQVYLAMPVSVLCRQSCKGLCPHCGTDLNASECTCESTESSSPFAVLRQLKGH
jgi:uncharacterized protein